MFETGFFTFVSAGLAAIVKEGERGRFFCYWGVFFIKDGNWLRWDFLTCTVVVILDKAVFF